MMTLVEEAERAEKIRNAFVVFSGPCNDYVTDINKAISELSSLSCVLREIDKLTDLDEGPGFDLVQEDLQDVHDSVTYTLGDIWRSLGCIGRDHTVEDYQDTWDDIAEQAERNSGGKSLHETLRDYKYLLESICKTMESHVATPTVEAVRGEIHGINSRRIKRPPPVPGSPGILKTPLTKTKAHPTQSPGRTTSLKIQSPQSPQLKKSYERERPMSPTDSTTSSATDTTKFRDMFPWVPSPPQSPAATMSSISAVSSAGSGMEVPPKHWALSIFDNISSTPLSWSDEETRYHEQRGTKEQPHPGPAYERVVNLVYPEDVQVSLFVNPSDYRAKVVTWYRDHQLNRDYGCLPLDALHLIRDGPVLRLCRRRSTGKLIPWTSMKFTTIERLVLVSNTIIAMRSQDSIANVPLSHYDDQMRDEVCKFAGSIVDSGFTHALRIHRDKTSGAIRLTASVLGGDLDRTPVWTAFVTYVIGSLEWCRQVDPRTVALTELRLHIFSARYRPRLTPSDGFVLRFKSRGDAEAFMEVVESLRERM